jgi:hypothetical protein
MPQKGAGLSVIQAEAHFINLSRYLNLRYMPPSKYKWTRLALML